MVRCNFAGLAGSSGVRRRDLLKTAAGATLMAGVAPRLGRGADRAKTLVFVGVADLSVLDPVVTGARAVFERFTEYQPRSGGPVGFTAGPKVAYFERVEWLTLDPFSASAALRRGEIDWWENPPRDLVGQVGGDPNITVVSHFATANRIMTFNQRHPPFDNPAIRRALLGAVDQRAGRVVAALVRRALV